MIIFQSHFSIPRNLKDVRFCTLLCTIWKVSNLLIKGSGQSDHLPGIYYQHCKSNYMEDPSIDATQKLKID